MPQAVAAAVVSFFQLAGPVATIVNAAVQVAVYAGISSAVANNSKPKDQGGLINLDLNPSAPRRLVVGKRGLGGSLVDWYVNGSDNTKLYLPIYISEGPCGTITRVFAGGRVVYDTPLVHGVRTAIPNFRSGGDRLWLTYYDGRVGQTADPTLVGLGQGWTSDNKMTGCAWVLAEMQWDSDNMRSPAQLVLEHEGAKFYDRRKDSTAGGSGLHRLNDPSTWELSAGGEGANPAVALDHFQLGRYWNGQRVFGMGLKADDVPYDRFAAQANICDEAVALKAGGTQKRYRANGILFADAQYDDTIKKLCVAMAAEPADFGGRVGVVGIEAKTPVMTIDDDDLTEKTVETYDPKRSWGELVGAVEGKYQDPNNLYQPVPYPEATDAAWSTQDGGEPKRMTLDLEFETNAERAQRLALLKAKYERRQATLVGTYPFWAIELERGDWFVRTGRTGSRFGETGKTFEVMDRVFDPKTFLVSLVAKEVDPADSAWSASTAKDPAPSSTPGTATISAIGVPAILVQAVTLNGTAAQIPALKVTFTPPTDPRVRWLYIEVENTDGTTPKTSKHIAIPSDTSTVIFQDAIVDGDGYAVSAKFLSDVLQSDWCVASLINASGTYAVGTASSVPWSGVSGLGKPADYADVTNVNISAGFTGQQWGATAAQSLIDNALVPTGANGLFDTSFKWFSSLWTMDTSVGTAARSTEASTLGLPKGVATGSGVTANGANYIRHHSQSQRQYFPCKPGMVVGARALVGGVNVSAMNLRVVFRNAAGTLIGTGATVGSVSSGLLDGTGEEDSFNELTALGTAPAGTVCATIEARGIATTNAPVLRIAKPLLAILASGQTAVPQFAPGREFEPGANVTETRVSSGFTGQQALATMGSVYFGSVYVTETSGGAQVTLGNFKTSLGISSGFTGQQALASMGAVYFGSVYVTETSGGAQVTLANFKTALGVSSGFTGQQALATMASVYFGSVYVTETSGGAQVTLGNFKTSLGIAAGFTSQGALAVMSSVPAANLAAGVGKNILVDTEFRFGSNYWDKTQSAGSTVQSVAVSTSGIRRAVVTGTGVTVGQYIDLSSLPQWNSFPIAAGEIAEVSAYLGGSNLSSASIILDFRDAADVNTGYSSSFTDGSPVAGNGELSTFRRTVGFATAPAGTVKARMVIRGVASTTAPVLNVAKPYFGKATAGQTEATPWNPGFDGEQGANVTETRVSSGFIGQQALATMGAVYFGSVYVTETSGGSQVTLANFKTSLGIASGFTGQGWGATASELQTSNALVPIAGFNRNSTFQDWTSTLPANWTNQGSLTVVKDTTNQIYGAHCIDITAAATANGYLNNGSVSELRIPAMTNYVVFDWEIDLLSGDFKRAGLEYRFLRPDASNINRFMLSFETEHGTAPAAGRYSGSRVVPITTTVGSPTGDPAGSALRLGMNLNGLVGSADSAKRIRWHRASVRPASKQEIAASLGLQDTGKLSSTTGVFGDDLKETSGGTVASLANFKTASGISSGFTGQQALATLAAVYFGSVYVTETSGGAQVTLANFKTALGIASAITGQGNQATANAQRGTTYSGTPVEGSWWTDTSVSPHKLKFYTAGAWYVVAEVSPTIVPQLSLSASPNFGKTKVGTGSQTNTSNTVTFTPSGGVGPYSYTAEIAGNTNKNIVPALSASSGSGSSFAIYISATTISPAETAGTVIVTVTDSAGKSVQCIKPYNLVWEP